MMRRFHGHAAGCMLHAYVLKADVFHSGAAFQRVQIDLKETGLCQRKPRASNMLIACCIV